MPAKSHTPISGFLALAVSAVVFGLGYCLRHARGFLATELRRGLSPTSLLTPAFLSTGLKANVEGQRRRMVRTQMFEACVQAP